MPTMFTVKTQLYLLLEFQIYELHPGNFAYKVDLCLFTEHVVNTFALKICFCLFVCFLAYLLLSEKKEEKKIANS